MRSVSNAKLVGTSWPASRNPLHRDRFDIRQVWVLLARQFDDIVFALLTATRQYESIPAGCHGQFELHSRQRIVVDEAMVLRQLLVEPAVSNDSSDSLSAQYFTTTAPAILAQDRQSPKLSLVRTPWSRASRSQDALSVSGNRFSNQAGGSPPPVVRGALERRMGVKAVAVGGAISYHVKTSELALYPCVG